jgi:hypothetical protein
MLLEFHCHFDTGNGNGNGTTNARMLSVYRYLVVRTYKVLVTMHTVDGKY